jgi:hypothetical protein
MLFLYDEVNFTNYIGAGNVRPFSASFQRDTNSSERISTKVSSPESEQEYVGLIAYANQCPFKIRK